MKDLIKEAIADAKSLKRVAEETAKENITESFLPQIKSMLALKLKEAEKDAFGGGEEDDEEQMDEQSDSSDIGKGDNKVDKADGADEEDPGKGKLTEAEGEDCDDDEDLDLESIIKELDDAIREVEDDEEEDEEDSVDDEEGSEDDAEMDMNFGGEAEGEKEDSEDDEKEKPDMDEDAPMAFLRGQLEEYIEEILNKLKANMTSEKIGVNESVKAKAKAKPAVNTNEAKLKTELFEAKKTIKYLTGKMKEALLMNSKLLYTGKIFRSYDLTEDAKISVLENFDKAKTDREVHLMYEGIEKTLKGAKTTKKTVFKEGRASKVIGTTKPESIVDNETLTRMQKLAGIIK